MLYSRYATTFIWAAIIGRFWQNEVITPINILGMIDIGGMWLMGIRS
ncbi:MAG: hypothetical protein R3C02_01885 [Planctomycetaceae bacterium]